MSKDVNKKILTKNGKKVKIIEVKGGKNIKKNKSIQKWLPIDYILENGIIKLKNKSYIKILKIIPINFNLKSNLEKEAILNSYKIFLKTCNFNIQILIQSNKEDLSKNISNIKEKTEKEEKKIRVIADEYIKYIKKTNIEKKSSSKNYYIIVEEKIIEKNKKREYVSEKIICEKLKDKYFNIKECLSRCGNIVFEVTDKKSVKKIFYSFLNSRKNLSET